MCAGGRWVGPVFLTSEAAALCVDEQVFKVDAFFPLEITE